MESISQEKCRKAVEYDEKAKILDVRTADDYEKGHIPNAILINVENPQGFMNKINQLDKQLPYYVYCNSGSRGEQACMVMDFNGFPRIYNLEGGFENWKGKIEI